jgi:hypothetical protein
MAMKRVFALLFYLALPMPSWAVTLDCAMQSLGGNSGYLTERYIFQHNESSAKAVVSDALILYFNKAPIAAKVTEDTQKKLVLTWDVTLTNSTGQTTRMLFRAAYFKADKSVIVRAVPSGYSDNFEARGKCKSV